MKKIFLIVSILFLSLTTVGCSLINSGEMSKKEMLEVVRSEEVKELIEKDLKEEDPKALTEEGVIKSYTIDEDSVEWNPMGGIRVTIIVNNDKKLNLSYTFTWNNKILDLTGKVISKEYEKITEEKYDKK